jgi:hypothetical protein
MCITPSFLPYYYSVVGSFIPIYLVVLLQEIYYVGGCLVMSVLAALLSTLTHHRTSAIVDITIGPTLMRTKLYIWMVNILLCHRGTMMLAVAKAANS